MKTQRDKWEADLRQKIEQHEFEYDPMAWTEMDQLLNQTSLSGSASASSAIKTGLSWWWQLALIIGISTILGLLIYQWSKQDKAPETIELSSFSIPESKTIPSNEDTIQLIIRPQIKTLTKLPTLNIKRIKNLNFYSLPDDVNINWSPNVLPKFEPLPVSPQPIFREQILELKGIENSPKKRKRNRKTLFPDVIENYKE